MGLKYRKSIKIAPGVKLNVGKKSAGISVGGKYGGVSVNSKTGVRTRTSLPGTGISYTSSPGKKASASSRSSTSAKKTSSAKPPKERNSYVELVLCIFLGSLGVHKFYVGKIGLGILYLFTVGLFGIGWIVDIITIVVRIIKGTQTPAPASTQYDIPAVPQVDAPTIEQTVQDTPVQTEEIAYTEKSYHVTGVQHYEDNLMRLATENYEYDYSKKELIDSCLIDENVYRYFFDPSKVELVPEPENPYDKNAIKVVIDGEHVGYIKAGSCSHLLKVLNEGRMHKIRCAISGGAYKRVNEDYDDEKDKSSYTMDRGTLSFSIVLHVQELPAK